MAALGAGSVTAVLDTAGSGSVAELVELVDDPAHVVSVADFDAPQLGARAVRDEHAIDALERVAALHADGRYRVEVERVVPLEDAAAAHRLSEAGHVRGKVVIAVARRDLRAAVRGSAGSPRRDRLRGYRPRMGWLSGIVDGVRTWWSGKRPGHTPDTLTSDITGVEDLVDLLRAIDDDLDPKDGVVPSTTCTFA